VPEQISTQDVRGKKVPMSRSTCLDPETDPADTARGLITVVESKLCILTYDDLAQAIAQAKSDALMEGLASFVVAAPEGIWCYSLGRNREKLLQKLTHQELAQNDAPMRELLLRTRDNSTP